MGPYEQDRCGGQLAARVCYCACCNAASQVQEVSLSLTNLRLSYFQCPFLPTRATTFGLLGPFVPLLDVTQADQDCRDTSTDDIVTIIVGSDPVTFRAHKALLASYSEYFKNAFGRPWVEADEGTVRLADIEPDTCRFVI